MKIIWNHYKNIHYSLTLLCMKDMKNNTEKVKRSSRMNSVK